MQLILVAVVIFMPQAVTVFLDKEKAVDLDKVQIEMPVEQETSEPSIQSSAPDAAAPEVPMPAAAGNSDADEQKKIDNLFK
jgi:hypothetical protein